MNDFTMIVLALGRGIIKILISLLVGFGVGLLVIGIATAGRDDLWRGPPPGELLMGIGAGLLSGGGSLLTLFFLPWFSKRTAERPFVERSYDDEQPVLARPAPRPMRHAMEEPPPLRAASKLPRPEEQDDSVPPTVRPVPPQPPAHDEPGKEGFYAK